MQQSLHSLHGFHLIEILITIAIIGILTSMTLPTYTHYLVYEKRLEATGILSKLAVAMEQYHLEYNTYEKVTLPTLNFPSLIVKNNYRLIIQTATNHDYELMAKPLGEQASRDKNCASLTLDSYGKKGITGTNKVEDCW